MPKVNFNPQGTLIQDEALFVPPQSHITGTKFKLSHDVFSSVDFSITYNGEALVPQVDYVLTDVYERARQEMGLTVYQRVQFLPNAPLGFTSTVYVTYRAVGDFVDANEITNQTDNDERYLKRIYNLSDIPSPQSALKNLESAASETTDPEDFGYDDANEESFSDVMVQTNWGDGIPMKVPFKEFADETARAAIPNPLPVSNGGTNAQSIDGAISNILSEATSVDDDAVRDDGAIPFQCPSAYQHQNVGKITLLQIFNNWLKSKLQSWLGITVTESGGSITGRTFDGNATTATTATNATTAAKTSNAITFSNSGDGAASDSTFDGSAARTLSYNSIGAAAVNHSHPELLPVGTIVPYAGRTAPTGWLLCNGQAVSKADYAALFAVIGYTYSSTGYQKEASSSYPNPNTTHFQVPDLRESVLVGIGTASSAKYWRSSNTTTSATSKTRTQPDTYILGQFKDDALQGHLHSLFDPLSGVNAWMKPTYVRRMDAQNAYYDVATLDPVTNSNHDTTGYTSDGTSGTPRIDSVTRGKRFGVNFIIKY